MIFKREFTPSDDELAALRRGEEWDPEKAKLLAQKVYFFFLQKDQNLVYWPISGVFPELL